MYTAFNENPFDPVVPVLVRLENVPGTLRKLAATPTSIFGISYAASPLTCVRNGSTTRHPSISCFNGNPKGALIGAMSSGRAVHNSQRSLTPRPVLVPP